MYDEIDIKTQLKIPKWAYDIVAADAALLGNTTKTDAIRHAFVTAAALIRARDRAAAIVDNPADHSGAVAETARRMARDLEGGR